MEYLGRKNNHGASYFKTVVVRQIRLYEAPVTDLELKSQLAISCDS